MSDGLHMDWARGLCAALAACGVVRFVVSPGSRSTPLALAAHGLDPSRVSVVVDERAAGFFALGLARAAGEPVALICTSGTAGAHYLPALIEASLVHVPLVVVTADRPIELAHAGASQTIDQDKLFGDHVRASFEIGAPDGAALAQLPAIAARVVGAARSPLPGPVHVNARFRKPLEPQPGAPATPQLRAPARFFPGRVEASDAALEAVASFLLSGERPLIVAGPRRYGARPGDVGSLAASAAALVALGVPTVGEATSGLSLRAGLCAPLSALLVGRADAPELRPDRVLELGLFPVARGYQELVATLPRALVALGAPLDPVGNAELAVAADPEGFLAALLRRLSAREGELARFASTRAAFAARLASGSETLRARLRDEATRVDPSAPLTEPAIAWELANALGAGVLCVGQSLSVRDLDDTGAFALNPGCEVLHQRGAAGIDGLLAGAVGARAATSSGRPVALLYGDVSALHDLGSFALLREARGPLVIVAVDNDGGRIFEELPIAKSPAATEAFDRLFLTRPGGVVADVARALGVDSEQVGERGALRAALARGLGSTRPLVIEARAEPSASRAAREAHRAACVHAFGEAAR